MTVALIIICLMVLLVIVDETESSGHGSESSDAAPPAEEADRSAPGSPCIIGVWSVRRRDSQEPRGRARKQSREVETEATPR
jgi:hypothetical protein